MSIHSAKEIEQSANKRTGRIPLAFQNFHKRSFSKQYRPMLSRLADLLVLRPSRHPVPAIGLTRHLIPFQGGNVEVWWKRLGHHTAATESKTRPTDIHILKLVGVGGRAECSTIYPLHLWDNLVAEVWTVNPCGFGGSSGRASLSTWDKTAETVFDHITKSADSPPVLIMANSLGTAAAISIASRRDVAGLILRNPPPLRELIVGMHSWWNFGLAARLIACQVPNNLDSIRLAAKCNTPAIFITSAQDKTVPPQFQEQIRHAYTGPQQHLVLADANHNTPMNRKEMTRFYKMLDWLRSQIKSLSHSDILASAQSV